MSTVLLEGYTVDEILGLPTEDLKAIVLSDEPSTFRIGSAHLLGRFKLAEDTLVIELPHVGGGGEGALPALAALAGRFAVREGLVFIEWRVHAGRGCLLRRFCDAS